MRSFVVWLSYAAVVLLGTAVVFVSSYLFAAATNWLAAAMALRAILNLSLLVLANRALRRRLPSSSLNIAWVGTIVVLLLNLNFWNGSLLAGRILTDNSLAIAAIDGVCWGLMSWLSLRSVRPVTQTTW